METSVITIINWAPVGIIIALGIWLTFRGLRLERLVHSSTSRQKLEEYLQILNEKLENRQEVRERVLERKKSFEQSSEKVSVNDELDACGWSIDDYDWRVDDLDWTIDDIQADIRNTRFEIDSRENTERSSRATFCTVVGAVVFAFSGVVIDLYGIFLYR